MKKNALMTCLALILAVSFIQTVDAGRGGPPRDGAGSGTIALTAEEAATLTYMREEEQLARDVYLLMYEFWDTPVFATIAASEQRHMDSLLNLLVKYELPDPALEPGVFADPSLQALYDGLVEDGAESELAALYVGALIEEVDMDDLQVAIEDTDKTDLQRVYGNLLDGSENHLRAFVGIIEGITGEPYVARYLPQEVVDAILAATSDSGNKRGRGRR